MKDYEQLYFDSQYEIKRLEKENILLKQEVDAYKQFSNKKLNQYLIREIMKYCNKKDNNNEDNQISKEVT